MIIYYAHPLDWSTSTARYDVVATALVTRGHQVFRPGRAWQTKQPIGNIQPINQAILERCDLVVAHLPDGVKTVGTILEVQYAIDRQIPTVVFTDTDERTSEALESLPCPVVRHLGDLLATIHTGTGRPAHTDVEIGRWQHTTDAHNGQPPARGKPGDAGFDLYVSTEDTIWVAPGEFANIPSEIAVQMPPGYWALILGRSSTWSRGLIVTPAVIDAGYRGPLYACVYNLGDSDVAIEPGDRVAQLVPMPLIAERISWTRGDLDDSARGMTGFGSTGR